MHNLRSCLLVALVAALSACGMFGGDEGNTGSEQMTEAAPAEVPVMSVRGIEIGRTRDGFLITAYGSAPGLGYSQPQLRPRRGGAPGIDGYIEYDFVATEPPAGFDLPQGTVQMRALRADLPVPPTALRGATGIRVFGQTGGAQLDFAPAPSQESGQS